MTGKPIIEEAVLDRIRSMMREAPADMEAEAAIAGETPLAALWTMLDSVSVIALVAAIEADYDISLPDDLLGYDGQLKTIADLTDEIWLQANRSEDGSMRPDV